MVFSLTWWHWSFFYLSSVSGTPSFFGLVCVIPLQWCPSPTSGSGFTTGEHGSSLSGSGFRVFVGSVCHNNDVNHWEVKDSLIKCLNNFIFIFASSSTTMSCRKCLSWSVSYIGWTKGGNVNVQWWSHTRRPQPDWSNLMTTHLGIVSCHLLVVSSPPIANTCGL